MGGTGSPASARSPRTFTRLISPFTSSFTLSSPHSPSSSASSSSRLGFGSGGASCASAPPAFSGAGTAASSSGFPVGTGLPSVRRATNSFTSSPDLPPFTPQWSQ